MKQSATKATDHHVAIAPRDEGSIAFVVASRYDGLLRQLFPSKQKHAAKKKSLL